MVGRVGGWVGGWEKEEWRVGRVGGVGGGWGGRTLVRIILICGSNPMSNILSASSMTTKETRERLWWVGGWVGEQVEEEQEVGMSCCKPRDLWWVVGWVGGWVSGWDVPHELPCLHG